MKARLSYIAILALTLLSTSSNAQLSLNLPKLNGLNIYAEPAVAWLPGGAANARDIGYGFGLETSFNVGRLGGKDAKNYRTPAKCRFLKDGILAPEKTVSDNQLTGITVDGKSCTVCYTPLGSNIGTDAWGAKCEVGAPPKPSAPYWNIELALGYGQIGSWSGSPLFTLSKGDEILPVFGLIRTAPAASLYISAVWDDRWWAPYGGFTLGLVSISGQFTDPVATSDGKPASYSISGSTLSPGVRLGITTNIQLYAEIAYEYQRFGLIEYKSTPSLASPSFAPPSLLFHAMHFRVGTWWTLQD